MTAPYLQRRPLVACDTECYVNYWAIAFKTIDDGRVRVFEMYEDQELDREAISKIIHRFCLVGFNFDKYDIPMILYAMSGASNSQLKHLSDALITSGEPHWSIMERLGLKKPAFMDTIDLQSVTPAAPTMPSLKLLGGRLHSKKLQELPFPVDSEIGEFERQVMRSYHQNDLDTTIDLYHDLKPQIELRYSMSKQYGVDLRSLGDPQIAKAVIKVEMEQILGRRLNKPQIRSYEFRYKPPSFIRFKSQLLHTVLVTVANASFHVNHKGVVEMPDSIAKLKITIGQSTYKMGIGGLHSTESAVSHYATDGYKLIDADVASYYPNLMLVCGLYPRELGPRFVDMFRNIVSRRIAAKRAGDKSTAETLKIVCNSTYGLSGSPYSFVYSPELMLQVTITGQLGLLMQIERLEAAGITVVSANTDGVVSRVHESQLDEYNLILKQWEIETGFETEQTEYRSLHSSSVNTYIAVKPDGKAKLKGAFAASGPGIAGAAGQKKNPDCDICTEAVIEHLTKGTPIEETIEWCDDIRKFVVVRRVNGGCEKDGQPVGKVVRWYYSTKTDTPLRYITNGNTVPMSIGAKPCMELPDTLPRDIDYAYYIREAYAILQDIGVGTVDPSLRNRTGTFYGRIGDQVTYHIVDAKTGVALCGKSRDSIRDKWEEVDTLPEKARLCGKCKKNEL